MTNTTEARHLELFTELVRDLHNGGPPDGAAPDYYGAWCEHASELLRIYADAGAGGVGRVWRAWCANDPQLEGVYKPRRDYVLEDIRDILGATEWLWQSWLPRGYLSMLVAESGMGKSWYCLELARPILTGTPWPDGTPNDTRGCVLYADTEASQALTLERADTLGLPTDRIRIPSPGGDVLAPTRLDTDEGWHEMLYQIDTYKPELVIIDSLSGAHSGDENTSEIRSLLFELAELARNKNIALLVTHHLRKRSAVDVDEISTDRIRGNTAILQFARVIFAIDAPDILNRKAKRVYVVKSNLSEFPGKLGYVVTPEGIAYGEVPDAPDQQSKKERAQELLIEWLSDGPLSADEIKALGESAGLSYDTLKRAKKTLPIMSERQLKGWFWVLQAGQEGQEGQGMQDVQAGKPCPS